MFAIHARLAELRWSAARARSLTIDAIGAARTARGALEDGDLRAVSLELAAGHLEDARRELVDALREP